MALRLPNLGPRARKILRYVGFVVLALVTFVFAFQMALPVDRIKDRIVDLMIEKYDVSIHSVERGFIPGRIYINALSLRTRPTKTDDVATTFYVERLEIDLGILALLHGTAAIKLDAKIGPGHIKGNIALAKDSTTVALRGDDLPSASLPMREVLGLPMSGKLRFAFDLELPNEKSKAGKTGANWLKAEGKFELACPSGCAVGDGKSKLKFNVTNQSQQAFAQSGIEFGKVNMDSLLADVALKDGKLEVTKFETKSGDGELHVNFNLALNQDFGQSQVTGCLRFNGSQALLKREPKTHAAISATGAPLGPDNLFHIKLDGPVKQMRRLGIICGPGAASKTDVQPGGAARPNLTVTPEAPPRPPGPGAIPAQPPPVQPPPAQPPLPAQPPPAAVVPPSGSAVEAPVPAVQPPQPAGAPIQPAGAVQPQGAVPSPSIPVGSAMAPPPAGQ